MCKFLSLICLIIDINLISWITLFSFFFANSCIDTYFFYIIIMYYQLVLRSLMYNYYYTCSRYIEVLGVLLFSLLSYLWLGEREMSEIIYDRKLHLFKREFLQNHYIRSIESFYKILITVPITIMDHFEYGHGAPHVLKRKMILYGYWHHDRYYQKSSISEHKMRILIYWTWSCVMYFEILTEFKHKRLF